MPDDAYPEALRARVGPEAVARQTFSVARKGFDQAEVRAFLAMMADELREARDREAMLRNQLASIEAVPPAAVQLDESTLIAALGEETAQVLTAARKAAAEIRAKGEESVGRLLREATDEAHRMRLEAEVVVAEKTEEAERQAAALLLEAEGAVGELLAEGDAKQAEARAEADRIRARAAAEAEAIGEKAEEDADQVIARATEEGRAMVNEALAVRERVLKDLNRKRRAARAQLEQLGAGRDRLLEAYDVVRRAMEEATGELEAAIPEAKRAVAEARSRVTEEPEPSLEELIAEVEATIEPEPAPPAAPVAPVVIEEPPPPVVLEVVDVVEDVDVVEVVEVVEDEPPELVVVFAREPEPEPEPEPELEPEPEVEPRDAGGRWPPPEPRPVRVPRKSKGRRDREFELPEAELLPVSPRDPMEEVRVVHPVVTDEPEPVLDEVAEEDEETVDVDALFAKLRSAREVGVAKAKEVLAEPEPEPAPDVFAAPPEVAEPAVFEAAVVEAAVVEAAVLETQPEVAEAEHESVDIVEAMHAMEAIDQSLLERRDAITDKVEQRVIRKLRRALADEQNEVLDQLRRNRGADLASVLPSFDEQTSRYAAGAGPELAVAAAGGAAFFGGDPGRATPVEDLASDLAIAIVVPLRDRIEKSLREAGGDEDTIADLLRSCYREWKAHRLAGEAHHVVLTAFNRALYDATEPGTQLRWLVDDGGSPCPDAEDNALAGLVVRGEPYPTGHCYPPAHPGCRCLLVPAAPEAG